MESFAAVLNRQSGPSAPMTSIIKDIAPVQLSRTNAKVSPQNVELSTNPTVLPDNARIAVKPHSTSLIVSAPGLKSGNTIILPDGHFTKPEAHTAISSDDKKAPVHPGKVDTVGTVKPSNPAFVLPVKSDSMLESMGERPRPIKKPLSFESLKPVLKKAEAVSLPLREDGPAAEPVITSGNARRRQNGHPIHVEKSGVGKALQLSSVPGNKMPPTVLKSDAPPKQVKSTGMVEVGRPINGSPPSSNLNAGSDGGKEIGVTPSAISTGRISSPRVVNPDGARPTVLIADAPVEKPRIEVQPVDAGATKAQSTAIGPKVIHSPEGVNPNGCRSEVQTPAAPPVRPRIVVQKVGRTTPEIKVEAPPPAAGKLATIDIALMGKQELSRVKPIIIEKPDVVPPRDDKTSRSAQRGTPKTGDTVAADIKTVVDAAKGAILARIAKGSQIPVKAINVTNIADHIDDLGREASDTKRSVRSDSGSLPRPDVLVPTEVKPQVAQTSSRGRTESKPAKLPSDTDKNQPLKNNEKVVNQLDPQTLKVSRGAPKDIPNLQEMAAGRNLDPMDRTVRIKHLASLADKIRARAHLLKPGGESVFEARLNPPNLGSVRVRLSIQGEEMRLAFSAERPEAVYALQEARTDLSSLIASQGYTLAQCEIEGRFPHDRWQQHPPNVHSGRSGGRGDRYDEENPDDRGEQQDRHRPLHYGYNTMDLVA